MKKVARKKVEIIQEDSDEVNYATEQRVQSPIPGSKQMVYQSIWIEQNEKCDVCLGEDDDEGDEIVMCD